MSSAGRLTDALVVPALRLDRGEGLAEALRCLREFEPRIFLIFGGDAEDVAWLHETLEEQAGCPILFAADLERGAGQQFEGLTPLPDAWALGMLGAEAAWEAGHRTAVEAAQARVRWILAPVLDLHVPGQASPIIGHRSFGSEVARVIECAGAFAQGVLEGGGQPCAKHFPGHGTVTQDSHTEEAISFEEPGVHLEPFQALLPKIPSVMLGHLEFPVVDESGRPASRSPYWVKLLREDLGYQGLILTDSLRMKGYAIEPEEHGAVESLQAGVDLILDPKDPVTVARTLRDSLKFGELDEEAVRRSVRRVETFLETARAAEPGRSRPLMLGAGARRLLRPLPGGRPAARRLQRPEAALCLAPTLDALRFLEEWGVELHHVQDEPPDPLPDSLLILWGAAAGRGFPSLPGPWLEAIHQHHPVLYVAGSPEAAEAAPASAQGYSLPGMSPALLALLFAGEEEAGEEG